MKFLSVVIDLPRSSYSITTVKRETLGERLGRLTKSLARRVARSVPAPRIPRLRFSSFSTKAAVLGIVLGVIASELTPSLFPLPA